MKKSAEEKVSAYYRGSGWEMSEGITEDARRWEDLREHAADYVSKCRLRVLEFIPDRGELLLDMASGPIQFKEYLTYSENFEKRYCVDLSPQALEEAKRKIGDHGVFISESFFDVDFDDNMFDCSVSLHTIYHMAHDMQEVAVRKLLRVTKPGKPVIIVYSNPRTLLRIPEFPVRLIYRLLKRAKRFGTDPYFHAHPLGWWEQFRDVADVRLVPWRALTGPEQRLLIPNNVLGAKIFTILYALEERFPRFFVRWFQYPMIVLTKRP
jgi:SAM-dependent methyltransferase